MKEALLASVRDGALDIDQIQKVARELVADTEGREALYDGLRGRVRDLIRAHDAPLEAEQCAQLLLGAAALALAAAPTKEIDSNQMLAVRLRALNDVLADNAAFHENYSSDKLRSQPHFHKCLSLLSGHSAGRSKKDLQKYIGIKDSNFTRILKILEAERLIFRQRERNTVVVTITSFGQQTLLHWTRVPPPPPPPQSAAHLTISHEIPGVNKTVWGAGATRYVPRAEV